jgi:hypothetical protein
VATPLRAYQRTLELRLGMADDKSGDICELCRRGRKIRRNEELAFNQWTDRGYVSCRVTIPISTCDRCNAKSWDEQAESMIEAAVRKACDQLP